MSEARQSPCSIRSNSIEFNQFIDQMNFHLRMLPLHNQWSVHFAYAETICFHFLPLDVAAVLNVHKNYTMTDVGEHLNCLGIDICLFYFHDCL